VIIIDIVLSKNNIIKSFKASGHALNSKSGSDIVCAAATCLLRTTANLLNREKKITVKGSAKEPGQMEMFLIKYPESRQEWINGITDFLIKGLIDLKEEYPEKLNINID
jgi:uncharacterized protein YsxB (DUF464 family)